MNINQEVEIRCLLAEPFRCRNRVALIEIFQEDLDFNCPWKDLLQEKFDEAIAKNENKKYKREYPPSA